MTESYKPNQSQLFDDAAAQRFLQTHANDEVEPPLYIPTGIFLQSFQFVNATEVNITGYIWQRYTKGIHDDLSRGFVLPEAVNSGDNIKAKQAYKRISGKTEVIGWYFESTLRQSFDYSKYPLDHKTLKIRLWHKDFNRNVILVPDCGAYVSTGPKDAFGFDERIELGGWFIDDDLLRLPNPKL